MKMELCQECEQEYPSLVGGGRADDTDALQGLIDHLHGRDVDLQRMVIGITRTIELSPSDEKRGRRGTVKNGDFRALRSVPAMFWAQTLPTAKVEDSMLERPERNESSP